MLRGCDGCGGYAFDGCAQVVEQVYFLEGLVTGHADVAFVAEGAREGCERDAGAAYCAFVDGVAVVGCEQTVLFCCADHVEGDAIFGAVAGTIKEFGFG